MPYTKSMFSRVCDVLMGNTNHSARVSQRELGLVGFFGTLLVAVAGTSFAWFVSNGFKCFFN